uniref:ATPase-like protein n=1 Tax=Leptospirillum ferrodiazotrophum TaxID=412449 RepID=C6HY00_9BACT|nr:MAG: ATPase-like protein [Leptospirillum ferrodiazotrophum]
MENDHSSDFRLDLLGPPLFRLGDKKLYLQDADKPFFLLFLLAGSKDPLYRDTVCDLLWPDLPKNRARANLSTSLYNLSKRLGLPNFLGATRTTLYWNLPSSSVDIRQVLFPTPPDVCAEFHPPRRCTACRREALSRLNLLSRPFLESVRIPDRSPLSQWANGIRQSLAEAKATLERDLTSGIPPVQGADLDTGRAIELRPLTAFVLRLTLPSPLSDEELLDRTEQIRLSAEEILLSRGGFIVPSSPEMVVAYFGYPRCREEEVRIAADCAKKIGELLFPRSSLSLSIGLNAGLAPCDAGPNLPDPFGRLSKLARTTSEKAPSFSIVATESTALLLRNYFHLTSLAPMDPSVFLVQGVLSAPDRLSTAVDGIFGREDEISRLSQSWEESCRGERRTVWIEGEAGIGKSALIEAFVKAVETSGRPHNIRKYYCLPEHQGTPWSPIIRSIRNQTGLETLHLPSSERIYRLERYLLERERSVDRDLPLLRHLLGEPGELPEPFSRLSPERLRETLETFLLGIISHLSRSAPLLLVLEDVHWADQATLALLKKSFERMGRISMTMILSCRERRSLENLDLPRPDTLISLGRLDRQSGRHLVSRTAGRDFSPTDLRRILDMGEGIPLYLRELALLAKDETIPLPPSLNTLFTSRTDTLPLHLRQILPPAAALGIVFRESALRPLVPTPATLDRDLEELCRTGLLDQKAIDPPTFSFHHALLREAILATLSAPARRSLHHRIADSLSLQIQETPPEDLAFHLEKAGRLKEAIPAYRLAASRAAEKGAASDAFLHLNTALSLVKSDPTIFPGETELAILLEAGPLAVSLQGHGSEAVEAIYNRASDLAEVLPENSRPFPLRFGLWTSAFTRVGPTAARPLGEDLRLCAREIENSEFCLRAEYALGGTLFWTGSLSLSKKHLLEALKYGEEAESLREKACVIEAFAEDPEMGSRAYLSWLQGITDDPEEGLREARRAIERAESIGHPNSLGYALSFDCYLKMLLKDPAGAEEVARRARELAEQYGYLQWDIVGQVAMAYAEGEKKNLAASRAAVGAIGGVLPGLAPLFTLIEAMTALRANEPEAARDSALRGLGESRMTGARVFEPELFRIAGEGLLSSGGSPVEAAEFFRQGLESAIASGATFFAARSRKSLAQTNPEAVKIYQECLGKLASGRDRV